MTIGSSYLIFIKILNNLSMTTNNNRGYKLPEKLINNLGNFDQIITRYQADFHLEGRVLAHCMRKEDEALIDLMTEHQSGLLVVYCRPETIQFQRLLESADSVILLKGRIRFEDVKYNAIIPSNAPYGTAIFSFSPYETFILLNSGLNGKVISLKQPETADFSEKKRALY
jgi:hypothetical protein